MVRIERRFAAQFELDRLVVGEPGGRVNGVLFHGGPLREVRVLDDLDVIGGHPGRPEQRLEHDPARPVAAGRADLLAPQVRSRVDPGRRLGEHDVREAAVDGRHVADRDAVADRRDHARPVADPDIDGALANERDQVRIDLVLEFDVEPRRLVVPLLLGEVELGELDARDEPETDDELFAGRDGEALAPVPPHAATTRAAMTMTASDRAAGTGRAGDTGPPMVAGWASGHRRTGVRRPRRRHTARSRPGRWSRARRT